MVLYFQLSQANRKKDYITSMLCLTQLPQSKCLWLLNWHSHMVTPPTARQKVRDISIETQLLSSITLIPGGSWGTGWVNNLMELEYQHPAACVLDRGAECNSGQGKRKVITVGRGLIPSYFSTRMSSSSFSSAFAAVQVAKRPKKCVLYSRASFHWWNENKIKILLKLATAADIKQRYWCLKKKIRKSFTGPSLFSVEKWGNQCISKTKWRLSFYLFCRWDTGTDHWVSLSMVRYYSYQ